MAIDFPNSPAPGDNYTVGAKTWTFTDGKWALNVNSLGVTGATGPSGPAGATGPQGASGTPSSVPGPSGPSGPQGVSGVPGSNGTNGAVGATGPQGVAGPSGPSGPQGAQGVAGPSGPQGAQGTAGTNGTNGAAGAQGAQGVQGNTGAQGPQGAQGPAGPTNVAAGYLTPSVNVDPLGGPYVGWSSGSSLWAVDGGFRVTSSNFYLTGLGTTGSAANLRMLSDGRVAQFTSSRKYKEQINSFNDGLSIINSLTPRTFAMKPQPTDGVIEQHEYENSTQHGFIVEEILEVQPQLIDFTIKDGEIAPQSWKTNDVISILVQAVQELFSQVETLKTEVDTLKNP